MFECQGFDDKGVCIAQPEMGVLRGDRSFWCQKCDEKGFGECIHMEKKEQKEPNCACRWIICKNKRHPFHLAERVFSTSNCNQTKCRLFES